MQALSKWQWITQENAGNVTSSCMIHVKQEGMHPVTAELLLLGQE